MATGAALTVGVYFDWENTVATAGDVLPYGYPVPRHMLDPLRLANRIVHRIDSNYGHARLSELFVAAGIHSRFRNPRAHDARLTQMRRVSANPIARVELRELEYLPGGRYREPTAIDELVWTEAVTALSRAELDFLITVTNDRAVGDRIHHASHTLQSRRTRLNAAIWGQRTSALYRHGTYIHHLTLQDFRAATNPAPHAA